MKKPKRGRPALGPGKLAVVAFSVPAHLIPVLDAAARESGMPRSMFLRNLVSEIVLQSTPALADKLSRSAPTAPAPRRDTDPR